MAGPGGDGLSAALLADLLGRCTFPPAGAPLTAGVSGGPDSLALLALAVAAGCEVEAVHVDHGLRDGAGHEAGVVAAAAARFGASFRAERVLVADGADLEARARHARRAAIGPGHATGHTADDRAETVLLALLRGSGLDGLAALRPGPTHPIVGLRRHETHQLCAELGLEPVHDPSNADPRFRRNRVRHEVLPLLDDVAGRDVVPLLCRLADLAASDTDLLDRLSADAVPDPTDARAVRAAEGPLARRALRAWLRHHTDHERHPPSSAALDRVLAVAAGAAVATELGGGVRVRRSGQRLAVEPGAVEPESARPGDDR